MFATPRVKKGALPPPSKKRKKVHSIEEIAFDNNSRAEYLTGFHKRKLLRQKQGQEIAAEKARKEKIELRKQLREERKQALEEHVQAVNQILKQAMLAGQEDEADSSGEDEEKAEWNGFEDSAVLEPADHEEEYIDEDRYTTVTVETVIVDRDGLHKPVDSDEDQEDAESKKPQEKEPARAQQKMKRKKFTYQSKFERKLAERKQRAKRRR